MLSVSLAHAHSFCSYITECVAAQTLLEPRPKCFLLTSAATSIELAKDYDQWGDPDDDDTSMEVCHTGTRLAVAVLCVVIILTDFLFKI